MAITCHELTIDMVTYTRPRHDQQEEVTGVYGLKTLGENIKAERNVLGVLRGERAGELGVGMNKKCCKHV